MFKHFGCQLEEKCVMPWSKRQVEDVMVPQGMQKIHFLTTVFQYDYGKQFN